MPNLLPQVYFPRYHDVFQHEDGVIIGYTRKTLKVTGTAGKKLFIGDFIVMASATADEGTIPTTLQEIIDAPYLGIYGGNDPYKNVNTDDPTYNHNVTTFGESTLTQEIVVVYRGRVGVARGGSAGTTRHESGLRYPANTSTPNRKIVEKKLEEQGIHVLRQVP